MKEWNSPYNPFNSIKAVAHSERFNAIINEQYLPPVVVNLDVTGECQYHCTWCHHRSKQVRSQGMPPLSWRLARTFPYFAANWKKNGHGVEACCIVGSQGDALLYEHLPYLLKGLHNNNIDVGLVTNGYGFTDSLIDSAVHYSKFIGISMDAAKKSTYDSVKHCPDDAWDKVTSNIAQITDSLRSNGLRNDVGYKFLILPENYLEIYDACKLARDLGVRYVQIRPADLPDTARAKIEVFEVEDQISEAINTLEIPGVFEIAGVRHKFTNDFRKKLPEYCYMTPLTVTVTSDGHVWPCVDRRCDEATLLADCGKYGWSALSDVWGTSKHVSIVHDVINCGGSGPECNIRCSNYGYDVLFRDVFSEKDAMDIRLI